jgi:tRNA U34 5-carboxymethylaminomethyl modifying enzyme MnmG/GidA
LGQAARIPGVTPAAVSIVNIYLSGESRAGHSGKFARGIGV